MATTVLAESTPSVDTATGILRSMVVPSPKLPFELLPHVARVPSEHNAMLWKLPAAIVTTLLFAKTPAEETATGTILFAVVSSPSRPEAL